MTTQIAKYRAEALDYRSRASLATSQGRENDAASYTATAEAREELADALEADAQEEDEVLAFLDGLGFDVADWTSDAQ